MSHAVPVTRYQPPAPPIAWLMRLLTAVALAVSAMLVYESSQNTGLPGCGEGSGCDAVLNSPWAKAAGVPVAALAAGLYAAMLVLLCFMRRRAAWMLLLVGGTAAIGAAGWFTWLQVSHVGALCKYCLTVHICGAAAGLLVWLNAPIGRLRVLPDDPADTVMVTPARAAVLAALGILGITLLVGVQIAFPAPTTRVTLLEGSVGFDIHDLPTLGPATAPVVVGELYDYTCPHCRHVEQLLREARRRYGDRLAVVALPAPLDSDCNPHVALTEPQHLIACELARLALAVWRADPDQFEAMHAWLFDQQAQMTVALAEARARELVGEAALDRALADPWIGERLRIHAGLHEHLGGPLPQLLTETVRVEGRPPDAAEMFRLLEEHTPLRP